MPHSHERKQCSFTELKIGCENAHSLIEPNAIRIEADWLRNQVFV